MNEADSEVPQQKVRSLSETSEELLDDEIDLLDYVEVIVRRRWMIIFSTAVVVLAGFIYTSLRPVTYVAEASVLPSGERNLEIGSTDGIQLVQDSGKFIETLKGSTVGRGIIERVVPYIKGGRRDSIQVREYFGSKNTKKALDALSVCSEFEQDESGVITVRVSLKDSVFAAAVANAYIDELRLFFTDKLQRNVQEDLDFIKGRLEQIEEELRTAEDSLLLFLEKNREIRENSALSVQFSRSQRKVTMKSSVYTKLANEYELARVRAQRDAPSFEVLNEARPIDAVSSTSELGIVISFAIGLLLSIIIAFILEFIQRNRQSGRLEPIVKELQSDVDRLKRLLGKT